MDLNELLAHGGFVDTAPVQKDVAWKSAQGADVTGKVWVVRQPFGEVEKAMTTKDRSQGAHLISLCIRLGKDGPTEQLTYEQAYALHPALAWAFVNAINEVNAPKS